MIKLRKLQDVVIKGNFTIKCENNSEFLKIQQFFHTTDNYIKFKDIFKIISYLDTNRFFVPLFIIGDKRTKFIIKYESLSELLKLRELFKIRANSFDTRLIKKRNFNPFVSDFYIQCSNTNIQKVRK